MGYDIIRTRVSRDPCSMGEEKPEKSLWGRVIKHK